MTNFWPDGIEVSDTASPLEILKSAQSDWVKRSDGVLTLILQETESRSGQDMIIVHAKHEPSNRTATLFSIVHRPDAPYPTRIQPRDNDLPDLLKKSYYKPGISNINLAVGLIPSTGKTVTNEWVCDTPMEFREQLAEVFNLGAIKGEVLNLVSNVRTEPVEELMEQQSEVPADHPGGE